MAQRMAAMQSLMNSMTPEQRAQLQDLMDQLMEDMDLRWQMDQLSENLRQLFPDAGWEQRYRFGGTDPLGLAQASKMFRQNEALHKYTRFSDKGNEVAFGTIGDASTSEGPFWEAINAAGGFGRWAWDVAFKPGEAQDIITRHAAVAEPAE